jgi:uncharacterized membrane protein
MKSRPKFVSLIWTATVLLSLIGIIAVSRRMINFFIPAPPSARFAAFDSGFANHRLLILAHIIPGFLFMVLAPLQFVKTLRTRRPRLHRWIGRVVLVSGLVIGSTALIMSLKVAIGGANETAATMVFGILFLFALLRAFVHIRRRNFALHREWMIRAFAVGMAVAAVRPIVGIFFATSSLTHLTPHDFFGTAFWLGFTIQSIVAEIWINYTRQSRPAAQTTSAASNTPMLARRTLNP